MGRREPHGLREIDVLLSPPPSIPLIVTSPLLALVLWLVCLALGYRALRWLKISLLPFSLLEKGAVCLAIGAGLLQYEPYALAAVGKLTPRNVLLGFGVIAALLIPDLWHVSRALLRNLRATPRHRPSAPILAWLALLMILMGMLLARALTLSAFGSDDDGYHLSAPRRWLSDGTLSYLPSYTNTNASLGFEMLYVLGLASGNWGLKIIHFSAGAFTFLALWLCARRLGSGLAGIIAISGLLIATPICDTTFLFSVAYVDFGACWMTLSSVLVWLTWRAQPVGSADRLLLLMALCAGFAGSFKSTALTVVVAWAPILVWEARRRGVAWSRIFRTSVGLGFVAFLPVCPWLFRSWSLTGNPVFPMLSSLIPTRDWDPEMARVFGKFFHYYSWAPATVLSESKRKAIVTIATALVLLGGTALVLRLKDPVYRGLIGFSTISVLISLSAAGMVFRYWLPAEMCVSMVLATMLVKRFPGAVWTRWLPSLLLVAALVSEYRKPDRRLGEELRVVTGISSHDREYASDYAWNMWRFINEHTSGDARMLVGSFYTTFGASNYGCFWLDLRCYTTDSYIQSFIRLDDWPSFARSLNQAGIRYLLISEQQFLPGRIGYSFTAEQNEYPFSRRLADQYGERLAQFGPLQFYRLGPVPETP